MSEQDKHIPADGEQQNAKPEAEKNIKERLYDQIKVPVWFLDIVIVVCVVALAAVIFLGRKASGR